ncbi:two-component sensor histidine kinase, partial [Mycobacteroides abscessus subsp. abscessus]
QQDVIAQIEELSTLVGDLVDLARGDGADIVHEPVDMVEVVEGTLERVRRRRNDIEFDVVMQPWQVYGDAAGLSRAVLNLLDNAAKWSPSGTAVSV